MEDILGMIVKTFGTWTRAVVSLKHCQVKKWSKKGRTPKMAKIEVESDGRFLR